MKITQIKNLFYCAYFLFLSACVGVDTIDDRVPFKVNLQIPQGTNSNENIGQSADNPLRLGLNTSLEIFVITNLADEEVNDQLIWKIEPDDVATIENGVVRGIKEGSAVITILEDEQTRIQEDHTWYIEIVKFERVEISSATDNLAILIGNTLQFSAKYYNKNNVVENTSISWSSSDQTIAKIDQNGLLTGISAGQVTVSATSTENNISNDRLVTIVSDPDAVASLEISTSNGIRSVQIGSVLQLEAIAKNISGNIINVNGLTWISDNTSIFTVNDQGLVTGVGVGIANVTVRTSTISSNSFEINVLASSITKRESELIFSRQNRVEGSVTLFIDPADNLLKIRLNDDFVGATIPDPYIYLGNDQNRITSSDIEIIGGSSNLHGAGNNKVYTIPGNPNINAYNFVIYHCKQFNAIYGAFQLESNDPNEIASLEISTSNGIRSVQIGSVLQLEAIAKNISGNIINVNGLMWMSDNTSILTVSNQGLVTGVGVGIANVTVRTSTISSNPFEINVLGSSTTKREGELIFSRQNRVEGSVTLFIDPADNLLKIRLNDDFVGATIPDPYIYLGNDQNRITSSDIEIIGGSSNLHGAGNNRVYIIPGNPNINAYNFVIYHCKQFNTIYGVFELD